MLCAVLLCAGFIKADVSAAEIPITPEYFPEEWMRDALLKPEYDLNSDGILSEEENKKIWKLGYDVSSGKTVTSMKGVEHLSKLVVVYLENMMGDEVRIDTGELRNLHLLNPQIETLKISSKKLHQLSFYNGGSINNVDVKNCDELGEIACNDGLTGSGNPMTASYNLRISNCPKLSWIDYEGCGLEQLKVRNCPNIIGVAVPFNRMTSLKIKSKKLAGLFCQNNMLTELDITQYKNLEMLNCNNNKIKKLDFRNCKKLKIIRCMNNKLTKVELPRFKTTKVEQQKYKISSKGFTFTGNKIKHVKLSDINILGYTIGEMGLAADLDEQEVYSSFARNKIKTVDISSAIKIEDNIRLHVKRFFTGNYVKRLESIYSYRYEYKDKDLKNRPIKKIIISKKLRQKDRKWIEKLGKKYEVKVVVR